jgi:predicted metal-dependent phosphoesterase TrpH
MPFDIALSDPEGAGIGLARPLPWIDEPPGALAQTDMKIDLHIHSTASDGACSPAEVVARARDGGLDLVAIADHDTVAGVAEAQDTAGDGLHVLPAIEISASHEHGEAHILGYGFDPGHSAMTSYEARAQEVRADRIREMIGLLGGLGVDVDFKDVLAEAGPATSLARPHLARVLWGQKHVTSISEAFDRFIGDQAPAFVPVRLFNATQAIATIHEAGGLAVWAHPPVDDALPRTVDDMAAAGMDGLECYRPRSTREERRRIASLARRHDLIVTGGSDWHGDWHGPLGGFHVDREQVAPFLERLGL